MLHQPTFNIALSNNVCKTGAEAPCLAALLQPTLAYDIISEQKKLRLIFLNHQCILMQSSLQDCTSKSPVFDW